MAWMVVRLEPLDSPHTLLAFADTGLARGVLAPFLLYRVMSRRSAGPHNDVIPPNMNSLSRLVTASGFLARNMAWYSVTG